MAAVELDLRSLGYDDLAQQMHDDLYDGMKVEIEEAVHILLERNWTPYRTLTEGLAEGMRVVGSTSGTVFCSCGRCCWLPMR